jgi:hypothetical protein
LSMVIVAITGSAIGALAFGMRPLPTPVSDLRRIWIKRGDVATFVCSRGQSGDLETLKGTVVATVFGSPKPVSPQLELFYRMEYPNGAWYCRISHGNMIHEVPLSWINSVDTAK